MTSGSGKNRFLADINVTPFVDVMLVLLIIFMVTAPMMMQGVDVALPEATSEPLTVEEQQLIVSIDDQGGVFINDVAVSVEELNQKLKKILAGRTDRDVYMKADKDIAYGAVVRVMSEIQEAGIKNLGMITIPVSEENKRQN
jgi:biopolymer transport protein TolR